MAGGTGSGSGGAVEHPVDQLIREVAQTGRELTDSELQQVREHVAQAGFDPRPIAQVGGRAAGVQWRGRLLRGSDRGAIQQSTKESDAVVTTAGVAERVDLYLEYDHRMLDELPEVAQQWDELDEGIRVSWSLDWDQVMGADLRFLDAQYRTGAMTPDQEVRYRALLRRLENHVPAISRLGLYPPPISLEA